MKRFVLLDRDGTINVERQYLSNADEVELVPGAAAGLRRMRDLKLGLAVVTNQSGLGRGYFDEDTLDGIHRRLAGLLDAEGVRLDGIFFCPHLPEDNCFCRKPKTGLVKQAAHELEFEPALSFVIGDKICDINLGRNVGATTILVRTGYGAEQELDECVRPDFVADDLVEAAEIISGLIEERQKEAVNEAR